MSWLWLHLQYIRTIAGIRWRGCCRPSYSTHGTARGLVPDFDISKTGSSEIEWAVVGCVAADCWFSLLPAPGLPTISPPLHCWVLCVTRQYQWLLNSLNREIWYCSLYPAPVSTDVSRPPHTSSYNFCITNIETRRCILHLSRHRHCLVFNAFIKVGLELISVKWNANLWLQKIFLNLTDVFWIRRGAISEYLL